jgi:hypothetical protein
MGGKRGIDATAEALRADGSVVEVERGSAFALEEFRRVASTGAFRRIVVESDWTHFTVRGELRGGSYAMLSKSKKGGVRKFLNPAVALALLRRMGVVRVEIEMKEWDVELSSLSMRMRPDVTARRLHRRRTAYLDLLPEAERLRIAGPDGIGEASREDERSRLAKRKHTAARLAEADERSREAGRLKREAPVDARELSERFLREFNGQRG